MRPTADPPQVGVWHCFKAIEDGNVLCFQDETKEILERTYTGYLICLSLDVLQLRGVRLLWLPVADSVKYLLLEVVRCGYVRMYLYLRIVSGST